MKKKVIIIGAGMGGLAAAIKLQHQGYQVEIYEQQPIPGGKMSQLKIEGHTFDVGPTIVMASQIYKNVFEAVGRDPNDYIPMIELDPMYDVYFKDTSYRHYSVSSNLSEMMALAESKGPETAKGFLNYLSEMYERYQVAVEHFISRPFRHKRDMYNPFMLKQALKLKTFGNAQDMMASFIPDKDMQQMLSFQTLYIGISPKHGPSLYNMIPMLELLYGIQFIKGGMHTLAESMAALFEELGGRIHYNTPVDEIVIENQKVRGIRTASNDFIHSPNVITNADFPYSVTKLVKDKKARGKYTPEKIDDMDYSCSCLIFYWGVDGKYEHIEPHTFIISEDLEENLDRIFDGRLINSPSIYSHVPSNADPTMAPEGKSSFYILVPVSELETADYNWNQGTIDFYREEVFKTLENLPDLQEIRNTITIEKVFTPEDFAEEFNAYRGAAFGLQPTLRQSNHWRPQSKSLDCDGLYYTGSSTHPGAGVPTSIRGGEICADELILDHSKEE